MLPRLIGLSGKMGSGKDAVVEYLVNEYGYRRLAFADAVKHELEAAIRHKAYPDGMPLSLWEDMLESAPEEVWIKPLNDRIRRLAQWWGTDYRRMDHEDYWVELAEKEIDKHPEVRFAISDVRYGNEDRLVHRRGGVVWMVRRKNRSNVNGIEGHISESLANVKPNHVLSNDGTLEELYRTVDDLVSGVV